MFSTLICTLFFLIVGCKAIIVNVDTPWDLIEGQKVVITCKVDSQIAGVSPSVVFHKRGKRTDIILKTTQDGRIVVSATQNGTITVGTLTINKVEVSDEVTDGYLCDGKAGVDVKSTSFNIYVLPKMTVPTVKFVNVTSAALGKPWTLICEAQAIPSGKIPKPELSAKWFFSKEKGKPGKEMANNSNVELLMDKMDATGSKIQSRLHFSAVELRNGGYYTCTVSLKDARFASHKFSKTESILFPMAANIPPKQKIKVMKGKDAVLTCKVSGFPPGSVSWSKGGDKIGDSSPRTKFSDYNGVKNAVLKISETEFSDRGIYVCNGTNGGKGALIEFTLRVKDPLGPLWPFIGILVETVVLIIIIAVGEKFRKKSKNKSPKAKERTRTECAPLLPKANEPRVGYVAGGQSRDEGVTLGAPKYANI